MSELEEVSFWPGEQL